MLEDLQRLVERLRFGLVRRVALLPQELGRPQERTRHLLPADDVGPLVDQHGQVAPGLDPLRVHRAEDHLRGRTHDQLLLELLGSAFGHPRHLRRKALDVLGLAHQQAFRDEQRKVGVDVAGRLEPSIERLLDQLPDRIAVRTDDHAALDRRVVGELRLPNHVEIPLREVLGLRRDLGDQCVFLFCHVLFVSLPADPLTAPMARRRARSPPPPAGASAHRRARGNRSDSVRRGSPAAAAPRAPSAVRR